MTTNHNEVNDNADDDSFVEVMDVDATPLLSLKEASALKLQLTPKHDVIGIGNKTGTTQVCATLKAAELPDDDDTKRAPVDIIVALDVSGSMSGIKLDLCKKTLELLIRQLLPQDRFGLVSFADEAIVEIPTSNLNDASSKQDALTKIKALRTRGCTNISGAIGLAAQEMLAIKESPNKVRSILLLTDGLANRGITAAADIVDLAKGCLTQSGKDDGTAPITIHCFGYGTDHDDNLLTQVSEVTTGGTYYFVENDSNVATAFGDALGGILSVVAQNATLNISIPTGTSDMFGVSIIDVHHENKTRQSDGSYSVNVGDFYAEESRDVLIDVRLAKVSSNLANATPIPHVEVSLSYMDTIEKSLTSTGITCSISRPNGSEISAPDEHVTVQWLRVHTANEISRADEMSRLGNLTQARTLIQACKNEILKHEESLQSHPLIQQLKRDLDEVLGGLSSQQAYVTRGTKMCKMKKQAHTRQRCSAPTTEEFNYYRSPKKAAMSTMFQQQSPP